MTEKRNASMLEQTLVIGIVFCVTIVALCFFKVHLCNGYPGNGYHMEYDGQQVPEEFESVFKSNLDYALPKPGRKALDFGTKNALDLQGVIEKSREEGYGFYYNGEEIDPAHYLLNSEDYYATIRFADQTVLIVDNEGILGSQHGN